MINSAMVANCRGNTLCCPQLEEFLLPERDQLRIDEGETAAPTGSGSRPYKDIEITALVTVPPVLAE